MEITLKHTYSEMINILLEKYGPVKGNYFLTTTCRSPNQKIKRSSEGLYIHHIKENEFVMLSDPNFAIKHDFTLQEGKNLVYCNLWEHFLLHYKIILESIHHPQKELVGFGGLFFFLSPEIIDHLANFPYKRQYKITEQKLILSKQEEFYNLYPAIVATVIKSNSVVCNNFLKILKNDMNIEDLQEWFTKISFALNHYKADQLDHQFLINLQKIWSHLDQLIAKALK